jgi:hypothetical protein
MDGIEVNNNFVLEIIHLSLGKDKEKMKNAKGAILVAAKLILPQNNRKEGSLSKKSINTLKFHNANAHERIENEILIRFRGRRLKKTNRPNPVLIKKTKSKNMFVIFRAWKFIMTKTSPGRIPSLLEP